MRVWLFFVGLLALALAAAPIGAATGPELLLKGIEHYEFAEFDQAAQSLDQAIATGGLSPNLLAKARVYRGLVFLAQGNEGEASKSFSLAKQADPAYRLDPERYQPKAIDLFNKAEAPPAPKPVEKPVPKPIEKPDAAKDKTGQTKTDMPSRGYVMELGKAEVTLDMGSNQGVKTGDQFEVIDRKVLKHPVTGKKMVRRKSVGKVQVYQVDKELSLARIVNGAKGIAVGMSLEKAEPAPVKPKQTTVGQKQGKPESKAKGVRVLIMKPSSSRISSRGQFDPDAFKPDSLAQSLSKLPGITGVAPENGRLNRAMEESGYKPGTYLLAKRLGLNGLFQLKDVKELKDLKDEKFLESLNEGQIKTLKAFMDIMEVDAVLIWDVSPEEDSDMVAISVNVHMKGEKYPQVRDTRNMLDFEAMRDYSAVISEMVKKGFQD